MAPRRRTGRGTVLTYGVRDIETASLLADVSHEASEGATCAPGRPSTDGLARGMPAHLDDSSATIRARVRWPIRLMAGLLST
jgi:hypothetical protein